MSHDLLSISQATLVSFGTEFLPHTSGASVHTDPPLHFRYDIASSGSILDYYEDVPINLFVGLARVAAAILAAHARHGHVAFRQLPVLLLVPPSLNVSYPSKPAQPSMVWPAHIRTVLLAEYIALLPSLPVALALLYIFTLIWSQTGQRV